MSVRARPPAPSIELCSSFFEKAEAFGTLRPTRTSFFY